MPNIERTVASVVGNSESGSVQSTHFVIKASTSATLDLGQNEARRPAQEDVPMTEAGEVSEQEDIAIPPITRPACDFPLFSRLPAELRLMIWNEALPGPRLLQARFQFENREFPFGSDLVSCATRTPPPALLGVCRESRAEALKRYSLCFAARDGPATTYVDLKADTLLIAFHDNVNTLSCLNVVGGLRAPSFQGLRHLALELRPGARNVDPLDYMFLMDHLRGLETFTLLSHERYNCGIAWQDMNLQEVEAENEPEGYRQRFDAVMTDETLWMPGKWRKPPLLKFLNGRRVPIANSPDDCLESFNVST